MNTELMNEYILQNDSSYKSKYKYYSCFQKSENVYKFHYYTRDSQLTQINLFFEINVYDEITTHFTEDIHEYEKTALIISGLKRMLKYNRPSNIVGKDVKKLLKKSPEELDLTSQDIVTILNYIEYHYGITQKSVDMFYDFYLPHFNYLLKKGKYKQLVEEINYIADEILYENFWTGSYEDYMDQQYYLHLYYFRKILDYCLNDINKIILSSRQGAISLLIHLFEYSRFTLCMLSVLDNVRIDENLTNLIMKTLASSLNQDQDEDKLLPYLYVNSIYHHDTEKTKYYVKRIFRGIVDDIMRISNHDMQIALGTYFLKKEGYDILIDSFKEDYNVYLFTSFEIGDIPQEYYPEIKKELKNALYYYSDMMKNERFRLRALEQILHINRIILEYFKEDFYE